MKVIGSSQKASCLSVPGFKASGISCGIKKTGRKDLAMILSDVPASVAGIFTLNGVKAAPVLFDMKRIKKGTSRGVVINSGNANACTGSGGLKNAGRMAGVAEKALGDKRCNIMVSSTGVIGVPLPIDKIVSSVDRLVSSLSYGGFSDAAEAIMTTDAFPKTASAKGSIGGVEVTIAGIAKGAGMICPDMATMLAFFATDANIGCDALQYALRGAADISFNSIVVDNDTSTNDTVLIFANALSGGREIKTGTPAFRAFVKLLNEASVKLSHMIVKDGEGATRFIEINIKGAKSTSEARLAAKTVAQSFLVKTAFFGGDPNWGRIMAALGRSGARFREDRVDISLNGVTVVKRGIDTSMEKEAASAIKAREVVVTVDMRSGRQSARVWTSDLTYDYVRINSAYRT